MLLELTKQMAELQDSADWKWTGSVENERRECLF